MLEIYYRLNGILLAFGAVLFGAAVLTIVTRPVNYQTLSSRTSLLLLVSAISLLLSLPALYFRQAEAAGWLGLIGHVLLETGILMLVVISATPLLYPSIKMPTGENIVIFLLGIAFTLGLLLTGIAIIRAGVFPRWAGILLLAAMAGFFFVFFITEFLPPAAGQIGSAALGLVLSGSLFWIGIALFLNQLQPIASN
jgi:hypothetical protein